MVLPFGSRAPCSPEPLRPITPTLRWYGGVWLNAVPVTPRLTTQYSCAPLHAVRQGVQGHMARHDSGDQDHRAAGFHGKTVPQPAQYKNLHPLHPVSHSNNILSMTSHHPTEWEREAREAVSYTHLRAHETLRCATWLLTVRWHTDQLRVPDTSHLWPPLCTAAAVHVRHQAGQGLHRPRRRQGGRRRQHGAAGEWRHCAGVRGGQGRE